MSTTRWHSRLRRRSPADLAEGADVAAPLHSYRSSVLAEAVIDGGLDDFACVYEQMTTYLRDGDDALEENPHWIGMLARRRTA